MLFLRLVVHYKPKKKFKTIFQQYFKRYPIRKQLDISTTHAFQQSNVIQPHTSIKRNHSASKTRQHHTYTQRKSERDRRTKSHLLFLTDGVYSHQASDIRIATESVISERLLDLQRKEGAGGGGGSVTNKRRKKDEEENETITDH